MSLVDAKSIIELPRSYVAGYGSTSLTLDSSRELVAQVLAAPKGGDIHAIHFRVGEVTQENSVKVSIQGVNTGGYSNGTIAASVSVTVGASDDNTWKTATFSGDATVTRGQAIAVVFETDSWDSGDSVAISVISNFTYSTSLHLQHSLVGNSAAALTSGSLTSGAGYYIRNYVSGDDFTNVGAASNATGVSFVATGTTPTTWSNGSALGLFTKSSSSPYPCLCFAIEYSDGTFAPSLGPIAGFPAYQSLSTATNPDEIGNYFQVPFPCRACGVWVIADIDYDTTVTLYNADTEELANCVIYAGYRGATTSGTNHSFFDSNPAATVNLAKDTWYRLVITGPGTAENISVYSVLSTKPEILDSLDLGQNCHMTQRTDGGAWSQTTYNRVAVGLLIDQLDNGVGGAETIKGRSGSGMYLGMGRGN